MADYDVLIGGAGPGGYVCVIHCAQLGLKTAVVESRDSLGGTCLNFGCIPSKALLHATRQLHDEQHTFAKMGLSGAVPKVDWSQMQAYKADLVSQNTKGIEFLFKKNWVTWITGQRKLHNARTVEVNAKRYTATSLVNATGSSSATLPGVEIDEKVIVRSTGALALRNIPKKLIVIGAVVIGLEMGSIYARLGAQVHVIKHLDAIAAGMNGDVQTSLLKLLQKHGIMFTLGAAVHRASATKAGATVSCSLSKDSTTYVVEANVVPVATERKPHTDGLGLEALGVDMSPRGQIRTDAIWQTNVEGLYAIGDVIDGPMLAHKAEDEGMAAAECIASRRCNVNYDVIPSVIYTRPEVAAVGRTEEQLKDEGRAYKVGRFSFLANGRTKAVFAGDGFVKLLADDQTGRVLGSHIISPGAGDLIHEICVGVEFGAAAADIARTCHAHPTFSEAVREAALACGEGAIHV